MAHIYDEVLARDITEVSQASEKRTARRLYRDFICRPQDPDPELPLRLGEHPRRRCEHRASPLEEGAAPHSITRSARPSTDCGIFKPSVRAVLRLTASSNLAGCSTGIVAGASPRRMRSTKVAA